MFKKDLSQEEKDRILDNIENNSNCVEHLPIKDIKMLRKDLSQKKIDKIFAEFDNDDVVPEKPP